MSSRHTLNEIELTQYLLNDPTHNLCLYNYGLKFISSKKFL